MEVNVTLINDYPRTMGHPRQDIIVYNDEQRDEYVRKYIKKSDLYISVYKYSEIDFPLENYTKNAIIDKVFFDYDSNHWLQDMKKVHKWCLKYDLIHRNQFSGNGGHTHIFTTLNVENKKEAVGNFQRWLQHQLDLDIDYKIIGDIARIFRYPNSYNFGGRRFCIPIPPEVLEQDKDEGWIMRMSTKQQWFNGWSGKRLLDLSRWDVKELLYMENLPTEFNLNEIDESISTEYPEFPPCVQSWLSTPTLNKDGKFLLILYLKDQIATQLPFDYKEIISILKKSLSNEEFNHYFGNLRIRKHEGHLGKKFRSIMVKNYYMPNCDEIKLKGYCPEDCGRRNPIYN